MGILSKIFTPKSKSKYFYQLNNVNKAELNECKIGDYLLIWFPENKTLINLYRPGTRSGEGKVGKVSGRFMKTIFRHISRGDRVDAEIESISNGKCLIRFDITSAKKLKEDKGREISQIRELLEKPYSPRKPLQYKLFTRANSSLKIGDGLILQLDNLEAIEANLQSIEIPVLFEGRQIGEITGQAVCRKILRGFYSGYNMEAHIQEIKTHEKNLKVIDINISFIKNQ
ncbi:MAG: hypothetical protein ACQETL_18965 [Bacteroidota bacterium]